MPVLDQIAFYQNRRDEVPNQELARRLAETNDRDGIAEIAANLWNPEPNVQSDCLKVLYEIGYLTPELIAPYATDFLKLLSSRNNRLVWGAMIGLSTVAPVAPNAVDAGRDKIIRAMQDGSVITRDNAVSTLAHLAASQHGEPGEPRRAEIFPLLLEHLRTCRPKEVPQHAEKIGVAVDESNRSEFVAVLEKRMEDMGPAQAARVRKLINKR